MPSQQNTYRKLDRDTSKNKVDKQSYYDCRNFRLMGDNPNESGALVNMLGNTELLAGFAPYYSDMCIGSVQLRDNTYLITTNGNSLTPSGTYGRIWRWNFKTESSPTLLCSKILNMSRYYPVNKNIISRYESETVQKIYWTDGYNKLRYANVADPNLSSWDPDDFNIVNEVSFEAPQFEKILGGKIPVGKVQYAYRLYKRFGPQTIFSPASPAYHLTTANESASNTLNYKGADKLDEQGELQSSGKAIQMKIENIDTNFDKIEIVAIHYYDVNEQPNIYIVQITDVDDTIRFVDTGVYEQGYYSVSEYLMLSNLFVPKTIATKNNILFAGNVTESEFDVDYDARAFRFNSSSIGDVKDGSGGYYRINWAAHPSAPTITAYGGASAIITLDEIPETWDCKQDINDLTINKAYSGEIYQGDGSTPGGEGLNVKYTFKRTDILIDDSLNPQTYHASSSTVPYYFPNYASPYYAGEKLGYPRDEIYRFGVILISTTGHYSPVKWIDDIRFPSNNATVDGGTNSFIVNVGSEVYHRKLYIEFTLNNLPDNVVAFQIVRVERKAQDRTVLFNSKLSFFGQHVGSLRLPSKPENTTMGTYDGQSPSNTYVGKCNLILTSPEVSFYKDFKAASGDYVQLIGAFANVFTTNHGTHNWHKVLKYDGFVPYAYSTGRRGMVSAGATYETVLTPDEEHSEVGSFEGMTYSKLVSTLGSPTTTPQDGNLGTSAIIKIASALDDSGITSSYFPLISYRRPVVQYGGNTYEARLGNKYIPAGEYTPKTGSSMTVSVFGGDAFVQFYDHLYAYYNYHYANLEEHETLGRVELVPIESSINLDLRHDDCWHKIYDADDAKYYIKEAGNASFTAGGINWAPGWSDLYLYNTVYSRPPNIKTFIPVSADWESTKVNDVKVIASNAKYNGEEIDAWSIWPLSESKEVDGSHGPINYLTVWNNTLLFHQDDGFGSLAVLERSLVQDSEGRELTLGEGEVLQRYDMISSETGCSTKDSLIVTPSQIIWFDAKEKRMYSMTGNIENLGVMKGLNSYFQNIPDDVISNDNTITGTHHGFAITYNSKFNEIWFTIKTGQQTGETVVYNEILQNFTSFIDNKSVRNYIRQDDILVSQGLVGYIYKENDPTAPRCRFHGTIEDAVVEVIVNPMGNLIHTLTNLEFTTEVIDTGDNNILNETISTLQVTNDYQDTGEVTLIPGTNIRRLLRTWRYNQLRDSGESARLRDTYSKVKMKHTNTTGGPRKIILHDLVSIYAVPVESIVNKQ